MRIKKKLQSRRGLTITEMLVALIILALVSAAVATGISNSIPVYQESVALSEAEVLTSTLTQALSDELRYAKEITTTADDALDSYTSTLYGKDATITVVDGKLMVGSNPLIGSGAYTDLEAAATIYYVDKLFTIELTITKGSRVFSEREISFRPLNAS